MPSPLNIHSTRASQARPRETFLQRVGRFFGLNGGTVSKAPPANRKDGYAPGRPYEVAATLSLRSVVQGKITTIDQRNLKQFDTQTLAFLQQIKTGAISVG